MDPFDTDNKRRGGREKTITGDEDERSAQEAIYFSLSLTDSDASTH